MSLIGGSLMSWSIQSPYIIATACAVIGLVLMVKWRTPEMDKMLARPTVTRIADEP